VKTTKNYSTLKTALAYYNDGVVAAKSKVVGLAPGFKSSGGQGLQKLRDLYTA
jgi:hypothetical protein